MESGCSNHMTGCMEIFSCLDRSIATKVKMGDGTIREAQGKGTVKLDSCGRNFIKNVLYVPDLQSNLLSVGQFLIEGYSLILKI